MEYNKNLKKSFYLYIVITAYSLTAAIIGSDMRDVLFSALMSSAHAALGWMVFVPALAQPALVGMLAVLVCAAFGARRFIRSGPINNAARKIISAAWIYLAAAALILLAETVMVAVRAAPFFICASLILFLGRGMRAAFLMHEEPAGGAPRGYAAGLITDFILLIICVGVSRDWVFIPGAAVCEAYVFCLLLAGRKPQSAWAHFNRPAAAAFVVFSLGVLSFISFRAVPDSCPADAIAKTGAHILRNVENTHPFDVLLLPGTNRLFIAGENNKLTEYDLTEDKTLDRIILDKDLNVQRLAWNERTGELYATTFNMGKTGVVAVLRPDPLRLERKLVIPQCQPLSLELDHRTRGLLVLCEGAAKLVWYNYDTFAPGRVLDFPPLTGAQTVRLDSARRRIYVTSGPFSRFLYEIDADTGRIMRAASVGFYSIGMELDPARRRAYLAKPLAGKILVVDLDSLDVVGTFTARAGMRDLDLDTVRRRLHAANYIAGTVQEFDLDTGAPLKEYPVGKLIRGVFHDRSSGRNFTASACGVFELK